MPASTLDPVSALLVIDLQKGVAGGNGAVHPVETIVDRARLLLDRFRSAGLPVVLVNVTGGAPGRTEKKRPAGVARAADWTEILPQIGPEAGDHLVSKSTWGAFTRTDLEDYLRSRGVTTVVLCGIATSIGVESTARQAHELGFNVVLATDAMTDVDAGAHANSVATIFPRLGETGMAEEIAALVGEAAP
jgi:nicotinamidase-related amidase